MTIALIVHGGAGSWRPGSDADAIAGTTAAVDAGRKILQKGGSALDAACAAAVVLEDNPIARKEPDPGRAASHGRD